MTQAKGVLPTREEDREVLYRNPRTSGYFIGVRLAAAPTLEQMQQWLGRVSSAIDTLVARDVVSTAKNVEPGEEPKGDKIAAIAIGLAPTFFDRLSAAGHTLERPVGFAHQPAAGWLPGLPAMNVDVLFYVASVAETRVNEFVAVVNIPGVVEAVTMERGYQRSDETEPFGYKDGVRNVAKSRRPEVVFVHTAGSQPDEPRWTDGGTYMVTMKIEQHVSAFQALPDDTARDNVIGRRKDGTRIDPVGATATDPRSESAEVPTGLPPASHVRKAGPRGPHDDTEIFRRGLPYLEVVGGVVHVGLQFCSFQANPAQFDTVFGDWMMNNRFPHVDGAPEPGVDALLAGNAPTGPLTTITQAGLFFVPPHHAHGVLAALTERPTRSKPTTGRLAIRKVVVDPSNANARFERGGFVFKVRDDAGVDVPGSEFTTASSGRGVCPVELEIGRTYTLVEVSTPLSQDTLTETALAMNKPNEHLEVVNTLTQPSTGYNG